MSYDLQLRFERRGADVDREVRKAYPPPPSMFSIGEESKELVKRCLRLETGALLLPDNQASEHDLDVAQHLHRGGTDPDGSFLVRNVRELRATKWVEIPSPSPFVDTSMRFKKQR
jgi:hypothetical protein